MYLAIMIFGTFLMAKGVSRIVRTYSRRKNERKKIRRISRTRRTCETVTKKIETYHKRERKAKKRIEPKRHARIKRNLFRK